MATIVRFAGNGVTTGFSIPFSYVSTTHVKVYLDGVLQNSGYTVTPGTVTFAVAPASGVIIRIVRETSQNTRMVDYVSADILAEATLNTDSIQAFNMAQEALEWRDQTIKRADDYAFDADNLRIKNVASPTQPDDAVPKSYADANIAEAQYYAMQAAISAGIAQSAIQANAGLGWKNRIINPDFSINQRNGGSAVPGGGSRTYVVDRWAIDGNVTARAHATQMPSAGYRSASWIRLTSTGAAVVGSSDQIRLSQYIEGGDMADLQWGTAAARNVVLTFDFRASIAGTYCASLRNSGGTRSFVFPFYVPVAGVWQTIQVLIGGDTTGTWLTGTSIGAILSFDLGCGTAVETPNANQWISGNYHRQAGAVRITETNAATIDFGAVQMDPDNFGTSYNQRPSSVELALCQRYFRKSFSTSSVPGSITTEGQEINYSAGTSASLCCGVRFGTSMRSQPIVVFYSPATGASGKMRNVTGAADVNMSAASDVGVNGFTAISASSVSANTVCSFQWTADAEY